MGLADDMKAITDAAQALVMISKHIAKENNQDCICRKVDSKTKELDINEAYYNEDDMVALSLCYNSCFNHWLLKAKYDDEKSHKNEMIVGKVINYCPFCGRKLTER